MVYKVVNKCLVDECYSKDKDGRCRESTGERLVTRAPAKSDLDQNFSSIFSL